MLSNMDMLSNHGLKLSACYQVRADGDGRYNQWTNTIDKSQDTCCLMALLQ